MVAGGTRLSLTEAAAETADETGLCAIKFKIKFLAFEIGILLQIYYIFCFLLKSQIFYDKIKSAEVSARIRQDFICGV